MVKGIIHNIFFKYPFILLVFPLILLSSPGIEIQINQPGGWISGLGEILLENQTSQTR